MPPCTGGMTAWLPLVASGADIVVYTVQIMVVGKTVDYNYLCRSYFFFSL